MGRDDDDKTLLIGRRLDSLPSNGPNSSHQTAQAVASGGGCGYMAIRGTAFQNTSAARGGLLYMRGGVAQLSGVTITRPSAGAGGLMYVVDGLAQVCPAEVQLNLLCVGV